MECPGFWPRLAARKRFDSRRTLFVDDSLPVLRAARLHGIEWLYAVRRPDSRVPARAVPDFPAVDFVHELGHGLAPPDAAAQSAGGP